MLSAEELVLDSISWLEKNYLDYKFFVERDIVWTVQTYLLEKIEKESLPFEVINDYPMLPGKRRSLSADLVILNNMSEVEVAVEFKYEPSHERSEYPKGKFPVVFWGSDGVGKDVKRIREFVENGKCKVAYSFFIDEGGYFRHREPHTASEWRDWNGTGAILWSRVDTKNFISLKK